MNGSVVAEERGMVRAIPREELGAMLLSVTRSLFLTT